MRKILCLLLFWLTFSYDSYSQSKRPLASIVTPSNGRIASSRIGCSLFTDANNYTNGTTFSYNAPINNNSNLTGTSGTNYGCMGSVPNQAWFIITVTAGGNLYFNFSNSNNYDVDAIIWGALPNNDVANACSSTTTYPLTCDYDATRPDLYINNAQVGQKYVMLVTNYSNANTVINISQPTGGIVTYSMVNLPNCSLTPSATISGTNTTINEGQSANLSLNFTGSAPWTYTLSDGTTGTTFTSPSNITVYPTASQTYTINSVNNLCGTSGGSGSVGISVVRNVQLKSCFPLDGNATDSQGINNGNLQNGVLATTNRTNDVNKALQFDGIDDYTNISTNQLSNNTFAFASWVKLDELPNANNPERIALSLGSTGDDHYLGVEYTNGNPAWKFSSNGNIVYGNATVNTDWHLLVGVRTGGQMKLYVDGVLSGTIATSGTTIYGTPLSGRLGSGIANNKFFKGKIDDVKIFNSSLIDAEVLLLQNYTSCSNVYSDTFISTQSISTSVICTGTSFIIRAFTNNLPIDNELQFVAELSDANGSFSNPITIGANNFLPLTATIPSNTQGGNYKIRIRYGGFISVNNFDIFVNNPSTYNLTGTVALNDGQSTNINLNFTGTGPWNYVLSNGLSGIATTNPWQITVNPDQSTVYYLTSASNVCGTTTLNGNSSAIVTVNFTKQFVSCLPFNGNANDENGNNTSTVNGPLLTDNRYGQTNAAYSFNGNYIDYSTNLLRKREYTMSAWVLANSIPSGTQYIISQGETSTNTFQGLAMTSSGWSFQSYTSNGIYSVGSTTGWGANQWVHLTAVCSYQSLKLYVNGNLVSSTTNNSLIPFKVSDIGRIGANSSIAGNYFNGKIDDIRLYKGALNDDEVYALYSNTTSCPTVENAPIIVSRGVSPTTVCAGNTVNVSYTLSNVLVSTGSPLNVILSDQNGSFSNPTIIGSGTSSPITATIPLTATSSNFYRIRLVSTNGTQVTSVNSNTLIVSGARPTAAISGGGSIQNGQSTNLSISFTGNSPWTYAINNGTSQITSTSPLTVPISPFATTIYTVTSVSNACGSGTSSGSATVTVAPFISLGSLNSTYCTGTNFSIPFQANFTPNTNFRLELSDATGGFTAPITIGTGSLSPITAQIPNTVAGATGYKIRIVSDNPAVTSAVSSILTINQKATATISGTATINEGQTTNLTLSFTGAAPYTYTITGGTSQTTSTNSLTIPVSPITNTTYSITSLSNTICGTGTSIGSAVITVNPVAVRLVSCFPFNGNANDGKGINNATLVGDVTLTTDRFGNANSAYNFDGRVDYIQVTSNQLLNNEYSYSAWINTSSAADFQYVYSVSEPNTTSLNALGLGYNSINVFSRSNSFSIPIPFSIGQWNHLTVTRSSSLLKLYINGALSYSTNIIDTNPYINNSIITIGALSTGYGSFQGKIDDVQIYKGVLTSGQVQALYNNNDGCYDASTFICPTNSAYSSILNGQQVLQVSNQITGNNSIQSGSNIHFDAGNVILLQPGFTTEANTVFKASVGGGCR